MIFADCGFIVLMPTATTVRAMFKEEFRLARNLHFLPLPSGGQATGTLPIHHLHEADQTQRS